MSERFFRKSKVGTEPSNKSIWRRLSNLHHLANGSKTPLASSGPAAAALISAGIGCFTMMVTHHLAETSEAREQLVWAIGSWIPGSHNPSRLYGNIGSYAGKETMLLVGWLVSWAILHALLKHRSVKARTLFLWVFTLFVAATAMTWHPLFPYLPLM